jgi:hypothetical protein
MIRERRMRDKVFVSHANPEDNDFTRWLCLRLVSAGYPVWCDIVRLKGGEDFWNDIELAIRERAIKFIYVLSKTSNDKQGPRQELQVAKGVARRKKLQDFIIPLHIDDLPHSDINILLNQLNAISFEQSWAKGLKDLLDKLELDDVPKDPSNTPEIAASWWRDQFSAEKGVSRNSEDYLSSWYLVESLPENIYFHLTKNVPSNDESGTQRPAYPVFSYAGGVFTFAARDDLLTAETEGWLIPQTHKFRTDDVLSGKLSQVIDTKQARNAMTHLLREGWLRMVRGRGLAIHELANNAWSFYFIKDQVPNDRLDFIGVDGLPAHRYVMGYKTMRSADAEKKLRHWHFGLSAKPFVYPTMAYGIKAHVLFSDDGKEIWQSDKRLHRARMSQCKNWWNDDWRDRLLATMHWLSGGRETIDISVGEGAVIRVAKSPQLFTSDVSFIEPTKPSPASEQTLAPSEEEIEFDEPDEDEDEEEE